MTAYLVVLSLFCFFLSVIRSFGSSSWGYLFLNWNLFLAFIPWVLTSFAVLRDLRNKAAILIIMAVWLLFFPNSPYILTDLMHLREMFDAPVWFDLIIVLSYAWAGLCYGFFSLLDIEGFLRSRFKLREKVVVLLSIGMVFLAAFGVYLGRFLRWNTWDIFRRFTQVLGDIIDPFADPMNNLKFWVFTALMGMLLNFMYFGFKLLCSRAFAASKSPGTDTQV
jgi:uncharacterized membrane protein